MGHSFLKVLLRSGSIIVLFILATNCERDKYDEIPVSPYFELEKTIRNTYDAYSVFSWDTYNKLLEMLSQDKFIVLPLNEMRQNFSDSKVIVGLRHDVDFNPFKALEMARIEKLNGIRSTYFFLATAQYSGRIVNGELVRPAGLGYLLKEIHSTGKEIGIHNDLLTVMIEHKTDPFEFNTKELAYYKSLGIPIYGTAAHGSHISRSTVPNFQIFSDFARNEFIQYDSLKYQMGQHSLHEYGFEYEAYFIDFNIYLSDSGGKWNDPEGFDGILKKLSSSVPGDRIQILVHSEWYGKVEIPTPNK